MDSSMCAFIFLMRCLVILDNLNILLIFSQEEKSLKELVGFLGFLLISRQMGRWFESAPESTHYLNIKSFPRIFFANKNLSNLFSILSSPLLLFFQEGLSFWGSKCDQLQVMEQIFEERFQRVFSLLLPLGPKFHALLM